MTEKELLDTAIDCVELYGAQHQIQKMVSEMGELLQEFGDFLNDPSRPTDNLKGELADVEFMLLQMEYIFGNIREELEFKVARQQKRNNEWREKYESLYD